MSVKDEPLNYLFELIKYALGGHPHDFIAFGIPILLNAIANITVLIAAILLIIWLLRHWKK